MENNNVGLILNKKRAYFKQAEIILSRLSNQKLGIASNTSPAEIHKLFSRKYLKVGAFYFYRWPFDLHFDFDVCLSVIEDVTPDFLAY